MLVSFCSMVQLQFADRSVKTSSLKSKNRIRFNGQLLRAINTDHEVDGDLPRPFGLVWNNPRRDFRPGNLRSLPDRLQRGLGGVRCCSGRHGRSCDRRSGGSRGHRFRVPAWRLALPWLFLRSDPKSNYHHHTINNISLAILIIKILNHINIKLQNCYSSIATPAAVPAAIASCSVLQGACMAACAAMALSPF